jgi:hypothetical protein
MITAKLSFVYECSYLSLLVLLITGNLTTEWKRLPQLDYGLQPNSRDAVLGCYKA